MTLRDALAAALWDSPESCENGGPAQLMRDKADYVLSDPAFREALVEAVADGMWNEAGKPMTWDANSGHYQEVARAIVDRMLADAK